MPTKATEMQETTQYVEGETISSAEIQLHNENWEVGEKPEKGDVFEVKESIYFRD